MSQIHEPEECRCNGKPTSELRGARRNVSARHRKTAIIGGFTFVLLASAIGNGMGAKQLDQSKSGLG